MRVHHLTITYEFQLNDLKAISQQANQFTSDITLEFHKGDDSLNIIDVKSLLGMMLLPIRKGTAVTIRTKGKDEKEAIDFMSDLIENYK
ncbi:HPr family phosphocarrier protein [Paenibacillus alkalitolerans]|uniref:HPr family phosphocarrier protein n=1 Tax=Paenibacillus alkalitolerans TaxID=2799335 RepID=UPI0018F5CDFE|nr:HPr family phosphocarrier protein [Paenibacillus alkalitolerans]